jgi:transcription elongation factor Elf1
MPGLVFQANAIKVVNNGGGYPTKTIMQEIEVGPLKTKKKIRRRMISAKKVKGSDYIVFNCPRCGKRNKSCIYNAKGQTEDGRLSFKCNGCYSEVEVQRPMSQISRPENTIEKPTVLNPAGLRPGTILGPDGKPVR